MRRVTRAQLEADVLEKLRQRQIKVNHKHAEGSLDIEREWKGARRTRPLQTVFATLKGMMGARERCMYCLDSHGTDIEHFWPKTPYPEKMFVWLNLLLCCTKCGRLKGDRFPLAEDQPLLIDPTAEDPWLHLDFDPVTGNMVARFDLRANDWSPKGLKTVEMLQLDRREALAAGYRKTFMRLSALVEQSLATGTPTAADLMTALREADDHGLLDWCFRGSGQTVTPFRNLRKNHPQTWAECVAVLETSVGP
jgi:uncharacterized protein (TIGR02646 family)